MKLEQQIRQKIEERLNPVYLEIENESHRHSVPPGSESHFRILVVSDVFQTMSRIDRQRFIYSLLENEMKSGIHALSQRAYTPQEWDSAQAQEGGVKMVSPPCPSKERQKLRDGAAKK